MILNGTTYNDKTPVDVVTALELVRIRGARVRVYYGDADTGRDWEECHDVVGRIGRSTGPNKIPILVYNRRSMGGGAILDHCIVKLAEARGGWVLYQHPKYHRNVPHAN